MSSHLESVRDYKFALDRTQCTLNQVLISEPYEHEIEMIHEKRKDLLIIALLQYVCEDATNKEKFMDILKNLIKSHVIDPELAHPRYESIRRNIIQKIKLILRNKPERQITAPTFLSDLDSEFCLQIIPSDDINYDIYRGHHIIRKISKGAYGVIYESRSITDGRSYAIKKTEYIRKTKWDTEVKIMSELDHPNIVRYYGSWIDTDVVCSSPLFPKNAKNTLYLYIQMELLDVTVDQLLKTYSFKERIQHVHKIFQQILAAVSYIHKMSVSHGDLKPSNVMIKFDDNDDYFVKVTDFGCAKHLSVQPDPFPSHMSRLFSSSCSIDDFDNIGTPLYTAPEIERHENMSTKSDIFSLGVILYEFITDFRDKSERLYKMKNIQDSLMHDVYAESIKTSLVPLISAMISNDPHDRPTCDELCNIWNTDIIKDSLKYFRTED